jgi:hypothetical protein
MIRKTILLVFFCFFAFQRLFAQSTPAEVTTHFFDLYRSEGSNKALEYIFSTNKYMADKTDAIDNLKLKLHQANSIIGKFWGYDLISKKMSGENLLILTYLVRHDREPLAFRFLFYKPNDRWVLQNFKFDDQADDELEAASKMAPVTGGN